MSRFFFSSAKSSSSYTSMFQADVISLEEAGYFDNVFIKNPNIRNNSLFRFTWDTCNFPEMYRNSYFNEKRDLLQVEQEKISSLYATDIDDAN